MRREAEETDPGRVRKQALARAAAHQRTVALVNRDSAVRRRLYTETTTLPFGVQAVLRETAGPGRLPVRALRQRAAAPGTALYLALGDSRPRNAAMVGAPALSVYRTTVRGIPEAPRMPGTHTR